MDFAIPADHRVKLKENKEIDKYLDLARELKKNWTMRVTVIPIAVGVLVTVLQGLEKKKTNGTENQRKTRNHLNYSIAEIGQNTE